MSVPSQEQGREVLRRAGSAGTEGTESQKPGKAKKILLNLSTKRARTVTRVGRSLSDTAQARNHRFAGAIFTIKCFPLISEHKKQVIVLLLLLRQS